MMKKEKKGFQRRSVLRNSSVSKKESGKNKFSFEHEILDTWKFLVGSKQFILFIVALMFVFVLFGFVINPSENIFNLIKAFVEEALNQTENLGWGQLILYIFWNNVKVGFQGLILGAVFGIFPLVLAMFNGYIIGFICSRAISAQGILTLWKLFPHGIFEIPAIFISLGLGLRLGLYIFLREKNDTYLKVWINSLKVFFYFIVPLLAMAAIIEGSLIFLAK